MKLMIEGSANFFNESICQDKFFAETGVGHRDLHFFWLIDLHRRAALGAR